MSLDQCEAIVLRSFNVGDQDKIVVFFSGDKGLMRGIAKGARKFGNRFGSSLEPMSVVKIFYYEKERKDLVTVNSCDLIDSFFDIQKDPEISFTLSYFAELIEEFFPSRAKEEILYRLLLSVLHSLKEKKDLNFISRYFEAWLLQISGLLPDFKKCKRCRKELANSSWLSPKKDGVYCSNCAPQKKEQTAPEMKVFLSWIKKNPPLKRDNFPLSADELEAIKKILQGIIIYHLEKEPKTLHYLKI